ncbi:MAG: ATP synthase F0 subunit C [Deltaproteobacteria bacterium]|nr:ATP synthase F0 subunit C [Deltaproteobacteria bacterium]
MRKLVTKVVGMMVVVAAPVAAFAEEAAQAASGGSLLAPALAIAAGFGIAIAALGGGLGQGRAAAAALEGIARNPDAAAKIQTPMIIALALIESLVIYALVIAFLLLGKIG